MSQLQNDPIRVIPKRVIQLALICTFFIVVITMIISRKLIKFTINPNQYPINTLTIGNLNIIVITTIKNVHINAN